MSFRCELFYRARVTRIITRSDRPGMVIIIHRNYEIKYVSLALICMPDLGETF